MTKLKISAKNIDKLYPNDNPRVVAYMEIIIKALEEIYHNDVPDYLIIQLDTLRDLWKIYFKAQAELAQNDLFSKGGSGRTYINPAMQVSQNTYKQIIQACKDLGITLFEDKRIKMMDKKIGESSGESAEKLMQKLLQ